MSIPLYDYTLESKCLWQNWTEIKFVTERQLLSFFFNKSTPMGVNE